jgi:hypothetical protein
VSVREKQLMMLYNRRNTVVKVRGKVTDLGSIKVFIGLETCQDFFMIFL